MIKIKLTSAIATLSLVFFFSIASVASSSVSNTGDLAKSGANSLSVSTTLEKDYSYLRFDVDKYINEKEEAEAIDFSLDYLRFDVNEFVSENYSEVIELPQANEFEYLRFDVNNFTESNSDSNPELTISEYSYLRFDADNFISSNIGDIDELPVKE